MKIIYHSRSREGAWIEISNPNYGYPDGIVAPVRERGLKCSPLLERLWPYGVAPVRERGLKFGIKPEFVGCSLKSLP